MRNSNFSALKNDTEAYSITIFVGAVYRLQNRQLSEAGMRSDFYFKFAINYEQAQAFRKATGQYLRRLQWQDITVEVII